MIKTVNIGRSLFTPKVKTVGTISDFLDESPTKVSAKWSIIGIASGVMGVSGMVLPPSMPIGGYATPAIAMPTYSPVFGSVGIGDTIIRACQPIIELIQGISYPVGFIMICAGFLVIMTGNKQKGLSMIKWAALGYIGMQFAPAIMAIIVDVGRAIGK